ncbi:sensor domain-containing protein [Bosea sp. NPDC055594]
MSEAEARATLRRLDPFGTERESAFDEITRVAAFVCDTPIAHINFVDDDPQWTKGGVGLDLHDVPLIELICGYAIRQPEAFIVRDLCDDFRFNHIVRKREGARLRFYAGVRLETAEGLALGMLSVLDDRPRPDGLTVTQGAALHLLAKSIMNHLELHRANAKLAEREMRFRTILDAIPQKIWTARPDGVRDYFNQRWHAFTGTQPEQCQGDRWLGLIHPEDRRRLQARWQHSLETGENYEIECRLRHKSGEYRWMLARAHAIRSMSGKIDRWLGTSTDIHKTKAVEKALAVREEHYSGLLEASAVVVWFAGPDGMITHSKGWTELTGQTEQEYVGVGWLMAVHPEDHTRVIPIWEAAQGSEAFYQAEFRAKSRDGDYRWILASAVPIHDADGRLREWVGSIVDIHDRKLAEQRLHASEERLRLAIETTGLGIWDVDLISGEREWSREAKAIMGLPADAPVTRDSFLNRLHPEDRGQVETSFFAASSDASLTYDGTYRIVRADSGEERWVAATGRTLLGTDGRPSRKIGTVLDITARKHAKIILRASEERLRLALQASRMIAWEQDLKTEFVTRSDNAASLLGIGSASLSEFLDRVHPEDRVLREHFRPGGGVKGSNTIEFRYLRPDGQTMWLGLRGEWAGPDRLVGVTFDITDRKEAEEEIWRAANHDALTGLPNRALLQKRLEEALRRAGQNGTSVSLLLIDFDHFKEINDALGHDAGDALLKEAAARLKTMTRECDTVARFSGDEFAVLIVDPQRLEYASSLAEAMTAKLRQPIIHLGRFIASEASIGIAAFPDHDASPADLLKDADIALSEAKAQGRNRVVTYCPALREAVEQHSALLQEVREALTRAEIVPFYQPKACLITGRIAGLEILARWQHPSRGVLTPGYFGAAFDDSRLALVLSESLLARAVSDLRGWLDAGLNPGRVAFNLSPREFSQPSLADDILRVLNHAGIPPEHFEVEVTETVLLSRNTESITSILNRFHQHGISIALDDFGTGFASLSHLKKFPVDHIKIDRSFVQKLEHDEGDKAIVSTIIDLGRKLGMRVTAEGVETEGQRRLLQEWGADFGQGYLFAKPAEASHIPSMLERPVLFEPPEAK